MVCKLEEETKLLEESISQQQKNNEPRGPKTDANLEDAIQELLMYLDMADCTLIEVSHLPSPEKENKTGVYSGSPARLISSLCSQLGHGEVTERSARERLKKLRRSSKYLSFTRHWKDTTN
jgi:hypothetical protein